MHERISKILDSLGVAYTLRLHADLGEIRTPNDFAKALGYDLARITKTLLMQASGEERFFLVVSPMNGRVDLKKLAEIVGARRLQMASKEVLSDHLGYPPTGVSPLGSQGIPVFMDSSLLAHKTILIGAGVAGQEIEIEPHLVKELTSATLIELATHTEAPH